MIIKTLRFQLAGIKRNPLTFILIILTALICLYLGYSNGALKAAVVYLCVITICTFIVDLYAVNRPAKTEFIVRNPKRETIYFIICAALGCLFLIIRTSPAVDWNHLPGLIKLAILPLILFVFPIGLAIIMLLLKYKPRDLGLRINSGLLLAIPIILVFFVANRLFVPESLTWQKILEDTGGSILQALFMGFITAGLSEEFFRVIGQTRIGALLKNKGLGWYITTVIWSALHVPKYIMDSGTPISEALLGIFQIVPIGLLWGYITHRTKSFLPATIVHGMNVWGLQNY